MPEFIIVHPQFYHIPQKNKNKNDGFLEEEKKKKISSS